MTMRAHDAQETARGLPAELETELAATSFTDKSDAVQKINHGIRARYLSRLYSLKRWGNFSDTFTVTIAESIQRSCDQVIRDLTPANDVTQPRI